MPYQLRPHQQQFVDALALGKRRFLLDWVPGGGKGSVGYLMAAYSTISPPLTAGCHVVPRINLRDQVEVAPQFVREHLERNGSTLCKFRAAENEIDPRRGNFGYVPLYQSIAANPDLHRMEFNRANYGLILDELQMMPEDGSWEQKLRPLVDRAAILVVASGTLHRSDRKRLPFIPYVNTPDGEVVDFDHPDWTVIRYRRSEALRDHAILPIEFKLYDCNASYLHGKDFEEFQSFSELTNKKDQRTGLRAVLRGDGGQRIADEMIQGWRVHRRVNPTAQALIITATQRYAKDYAAWLREAHPDLKVRVAISDNPGSAKVLREFCRGKGDVLITVGMAYVGMDAKRISHISLLTLVRSRGWVEQAISRGVRVNEDTSAGGWSRQRCHVYAPRDPLLVDVVREIEAEQAQVIDDENRDPRKPADPPEEKDLITFSSGLGSYRSHELNIANLTPDLSAQLAAAISVHDLPITPMQFFHLQNSYFGAPRMEYQASAPEVGEREREKTMKDSIEERVRRVDRHLGREFGATNKQMFAVFKKSRTDMRLSELSQVIGWLDANYPWSRPSDE